MPEVVRHGLSAKPSDGLLLGDAIVTRLVETFYFIELRATKCGGH